MDAAQTEKLKALALAAKKGGDIFTMWDRLCVFQAEANPATVLELIAEVERLRADADRYRWLHAKSPDTICAIAWSVPAACHFGEPDAAIDAAILAHTKAREGA